MSLLTDASPHLARLLKRSMVQTPALYPAAQIRCETVMAPMRDGTLLATDLYLPPKLPAPVLAVRTHVGRDMDQGIGVSIFLARRGYVIVSQDVRGTGGSQPASWDYMVHEAEDGYDLAEWITQQSWYDGYIGGLGGSYLGLTQFSMAQHPAMSAVLPEVTGIGDAVTTAHMHLFLDSYARSVGKGADKVDVPYYEFEAQMLEETLATGYFNEALHKPFSQALRERYPEISAMDPMQAKRWLWGRYCALDCNGRAEFIKHARGVKQVTILDIEAMSEVFGHEIWHARYALPHTDLDALYRTFNAPMLLRTGWYDWALNNTLATWDLLMRAAPEPIRSRCRLLLAPGAHNMPGYHEGMDTHPELQHSHGAATNFELLLHWNDSMRRGDIEAWPTVVYYLMGANEWRTADAWPVPGAEPTPYYFSPDGVLSRDLPPLSSPDRYVYDPDEPTPTVGGSIVSYTYPPGSVDVATVQARPDVLTYTTAPLGEDLDVVGPLKCVLYASSSAVDTDFVVRLTDVFPDGRAIQLQNGILRARYRDPHGEPALLEAGKVYRLEIELWATANRFKAGHRVRVDVSSSDFPRFDRNANRGGEPGAPIRATQAIHHDPERPSHILLPVL